ncbi:hypothetical protein, partial [Paenibacillus tuaregi]|uniref:hypothetical protein n=1 Tax=Paenibacillus tuaregi TaxID=1816681 RepID=UPI00138F9DB6
MKKALQQEDRVEASEGELRVTFPTEEQRENKKAAASKGQEPCRVTLPLEASGADLEETLVNYFSSHPLELAALLQGGEPSLASDLLPPEPPWAQGRAP